MPAHSRRRALTATFLATLTTTVMTGTLMTAAAATTDPIGGAELASSREVWQATPGTPRPPAIPAKAYLLADLTTGQILVAKGAHVRLRTASTMKVLTALTLLPRLSQSAVYTARTADEDIDGSRVGIVAGSKYTVHQLFQGMMLSSGNDAANALANAAGGVPGTVALMQQEATSLDALDTTVRDPSGLDSPGQRSSAYDLALIARAAMQRPDFRALVATKTARFPGATVKGKQHKGFEIQNHNALLTNYPGAIGVKNGYTVAARWTYIGAARRQGHTYLVTELGLDQLGWKPATKLLDWAFAHGAAATPIGQLVDPVAATTSTSRSTAAAPLPAVPLTRSSPSPKGATAWTGIRLTGAALVGLGVLILGGLGRSAARRRRR